MKHSLRLAVIAGIAGAMLAAVPARAEKADRDKIAIWFGDIRVANKGLRDPAYDEARVSDYMKGENIEMRVNVGVGKARAKVWTCDLTKEYVAINGDYRS